MTVRRISDTIDKWIGLSTDPKPSVANVGSYFVVEDNEDLFLRTKNSWLQLLSGGSLGGGNPFSEPVQILVDGDNNAPALGMGEAGNTGFAVQTIDYGGGFFLSRLRLVTSDSYGTPSPLIFGADGFSTLNDWPIGWYPLSGFEELTAESAPTIRISGVTGFSSEPVLSVFPTTPETRVILRLTSQQSGGDVYNYLEIEAQAHPDDYRIYPRTGGGGTGLRGLQIGISGSRLGFFGTTAIAKPTVSGAKAGNAALTDLITELANLGLITDSTS